MVAAVSVLLFTGLYLNAPWEMLQLPLRTVRRIHTLFAFILMTNLTGQIYYYQYTTKFTEVLFLPRDWANVPSFIRYILFITDSHPNYGRYNPGQKLQFSLWLLAVLLAAVTGMLLLFPDPASWLQRILGGLNVIRILHLSVAVFFAMSIPLHLYLVFTESPANLQAMFTGYINKEITPEILTEEKKDPGI
jgi:Ni/Fe-hydrogenase 1 B-type cytochrome subunit